MRPESCKDKLGRPCSCYGITPTCVATGRALVNVGVDAISIDSLTHTRKGVCRCITNGEEKYPHLMWCGNIATGDAKALVKAGADAVESRNRTRAVFAPPGLWQALVYAIICLAQCSTGHQR
ncbi:MAG: IMP dehydrogenase [Bacteroidetes bacterium]|nr:IMP dehydrogenase [Bacteroidota bacterium]